MTTSQYLSRCVLLFLVFSPVAMAQVPLARLKPADVGEAIAQGAGRQRAGAELREQGLAIRIEGPFARVVNLSGAASRRGESLRPSEIKPEVLQPVVSIHVSPDLSVVGGISLEPLKRVYISGNSSGAKSGTIARPVREVLEPLEYSPGFAGAEVGHELIATFESQALSMAGFQLVVEANGREVRVSVPRELLRQIR